MVVSISAPHVTCTDAAPQPLPRVRPSQRHRSRREADDDIDAEMPTPAAQKVKMLAAAKVAAKPRTRPKKRPSAAVLEEQALALLDLGESDSDGPPGLCCSSNGSDDDAYTAEALDRSVDAFFGRDESDAELDSESDAEPDAPFEDLTRVVISNMLDKLPTTDYVSLVQTWRDMATLQLTFDDNNLPCGSGCSGSGMEHTVCLALAAELNDRTGIDVRFAAALACELDPRKRSWLEHVHSPEVMESDVCTLADSPAVPQFLFSFSFGFSCKDLSTLNNVSGDFKETCLSTERDASARGSTGKTWAGCIAYVDATRPLVLFIENVLAALKGSNWTVILRDLSEIGYKVVGKQLNARDYGFPQGRRRAWIVAVLEWPGVFHTPAHGHGSGTFESRYSSLVETLRTPPVDLERFLLPTGHPYLEMMKEKCRKKASKRSSGKQTWICDHWQTRRRLELDTHSGTTWIQDAVLDNSLQPREIDILEILNSEGIKDVTVDLKHSASRSVGGESSSGSRDTTTCVLPSSRMLLLRNARPRLLTGLEALRIQGMAIEPMLSPDCPVNDTVLMILAGNAFCAGPCAAVIISALASIRVPSAV